MKVQWQDKEWEWNDFDQKLLQVNDWTNDFNLALECLSNAKRRVAIQAGGAMGLWPYEMAKHFEKVYTFEPNEDNFRCLCENTKDLPNVVARNAGLSNTIGYCMTKLPVSEQNNAGAFYTMPTTDTNAILQLVLDEFIPSDKEDQVDLIQLDVEGRELEVLQGAKNIIGKSSPVIMLEEKRLPQDRETGHVVGQVEQYLISLGYKAKHRIHRDIIFLRD